MTPDELAELRRFAGEVEEYERAHADPPREAAEDAEYAKLAAAYPGEFVAYLDRWDGTALNRQVLAHAPTHRAVSDALAHLSDDELDRVGVLFAHPPVPLVTRTWTGEARTAQPRGS